MKIKSCRICGSEKLYPFLSLGSMPPPNGFLLKKDLGKTEKVYPLSVCLCESCFLVQLKDVIPAKIMFNNYLYIPSTSTTMLGHFKNFADEIVRDFNLKKGDLVVDIGSNDGTLLTFFKEQELNILGVDPASNLAQVAKLKGINTINDFFTLGVSKIIKKIYGSAQVITATNVVPHINDLHDFALGVKNLLSTDGILVIEFPYLVDLLEKNSFDTIYHEHLSYFSLKPLFKLFRSHGMKIFDIKKQNVHGGSLRLFITKSSIYKIKNSANEFLAFEKLKSIDNLKTYLNFADRVLVFKKNLINFLEKLKKRKKRIVGYGAAAKGNVLLNFCKIGSETIDYIVDSIPFKQGRFTPGTHIPIYPEGRLEKDRSDYALLLAWNFADEILKKQKKYRQKGGKFIVTTPQLKII